jgi:hypothetical protein
VKYRAGNEANGKAKIIFTDRYRRRCQRRRCRPRRSDSKAAPCSYSPSAHCHSNNPLCGRYPRCSSGIRRSPRGRRTARWGPTGSHARRGRSSDYSGTCRTTCSGRARRRQRKAAPLASSTPLSVSIRYLLPNVPPTSAPVSPVNAGRRDRREQRSGVQSSQQARVRVRRSMSPEQKSL